MKSKLVLGYSRVSSSGQVESGLSLDAQQEKIHNYCSLHDLSLSEVITDAGLSGKSVSGRPGILQILDLVRQGRVSDVIILKLDRLCRNVAEAAQIVDLFQKKGVSLHSVQERLDTGSASGRLFFNILSSMAAWERETIAERTVTALNVKRSKAKRISRFAPYGYKFDNDDNIVIDEGEQTVIKKILELRRDGYTIRQIGEFLETEGYRNRKGNSFGVREVWEIARKAA